MNKCDCNKPKCEPSKCRTDGFVFRKVVIPAQLGDDETGQEKPENGAMTNAFVTYAANGAQYIYDSFGVYTKFSASAEVPVLSVNGKVGRVILTTSDLENDSDYVTASYVAEAIGTEMAERKAADEELAKPMVGATSSTDGKSGMVPKPLAGDEEKVLMGNGTWGDASTQTIFYANSQETGNTRHIYKDAAFTQAASAQDLLDANEEGPIVLRITTNPNPNGLFSDAYIQNTYVGTGDYQFLFLDERTYREYAASAPSDTTFYYFSNTIQSKLTAGTNIDITNNVISASIPIDTNYDAQSGNPVANSTITNSLNRSVVTDMAINATPSTTTVSLDETKTNLASPSSSTTTTVALPVASTNQAGIMNKATYDSLTQAVQDIANIKSEVVAITGLPANPTQQELTTAWMAASGETALINGAGIYDTTNEKRWTYYSNDTTWHWLDANASIHVQQWTNSAAGIVKGSAVDGQIYAESDGTGSVNGWDTLTTAVGNNTSKLGTIEQGAEVNVQANWTEADSSSDAYIQNKPSIPTNTSDLNNDSNFITGTNVGSQIIPVYINNGVATAAKVNASGANWNIIPQVKGDGVMEIGKFIDFHSTDAGTTDQDARIENVTTDVLKIGGDNGDLRIKKDNNTDFSLRTIATTASYIGSTIGQPSSLAYVGSANIQDSAVTTAKIADLNVTTNKLATGAVTSDKIDYTTLGATLWSGDSHGTSIVLSEDPTNYKYLIFVFNSSSNGTANSTCKIPTGPSIRYTVSAPFMFENGGIAIDCIQYTASGTTLSVKYQGFAGIGNNGNTTVSQTTGIHVIKIIGTDIDV